MRTRHRVCAPILTRCHWMYFLRQYFRRVNSLILQSWAAVESETSSSAIGWAWLSDNGFMLIRWVSLLLGCFQACESLTDTVPDRVCYCGDRANAGPHRAAWNARKVNDDDGGTSSAVTVFCLRWPKAVLTDNPGPLTRRAPLSAPGF